MKKLFFILLAISLFHQFTGAQWVQQVSGVTSPLYDCDFVDQNTGWACGSSGRILKTTNGGINWIQQTSGVTKLLQGIDAVDANILYCVGYDETILKTTNSGTNWIAIRNGPPMMGGSFSKAFFLNENTGWILRNNYILRTTNSCATFDSTFVVFTFLRDIYFKDALTGVLCANGARIMKSTDGGVVWNLISVPLYNFEQPDFFRLSFVNNTFGWVVGSGDNSGLGMLVYRTIDFGSSWDTIGRVKYPIGELNYSVYFPSLNTGYCGAVSIFKTTNGGFNWYQQALPINGFRSDFSFVNDTVGWVVGGGGYILRTTNGGTYLGIEPITNSIPGKFQLYQNYPNPFNPKTIIRFQIIRLSDLKLAVYNVQGKQITELVNGKYSTGTYEVEWDASDYPSGIYFYYIQAGSFTDTKKMVLIK